MVDVAGNGGTFWREVVRLSAVDFLTGEILLNTLVLPTAKVIRWKSDITGITAETITEAKQRRGHGLLKGWKAARAELWRFINADTVLIGQSLHHDLEVLGMLHRRVVDSAILAAAAASGGGGPTVTGARPRTFGLKLMCRELLGVDVQCCGDGQVHDCLEDVLATRELVLWMLCNPRELRMWAVEKNGEGVAPRPGKIKGKRKGKENAVGADIWGYRGGGGRLGGDNYDEEEEEEEILQWADIAEDIGWPHPNTGYDPWSD